MVIVANHGNDPFQVSSYRFQVSGKICVMCAT